ncbi:MAG: hypothetical protein KJN99_08125 [Marinicaulis sp.]|nr:hypothetical protein [Marinicaulis sp.]
MELIAQICEAPIAVVNLIDEHRQWFKAETGLGTRETPLDTSICSHIILEKDFVEIHDTLEDPRMRDNPLCLDDPGLRFYAGALLKTKTGLPIGTLCVLDHVPRTLTDFQRKSIRIHATNVMKQLDLRFALRRQELLRYEIDHRVKNSLQAVLSLIHLSSTAIEDEKTRGIMNTLSRRVSAIALLHGELCRTDAAEVIGLDDYLSRIVDLLSEYLPDGLSLVDEIEPLNVPVATACAVGVIVSEFVANAQKHGFGGRQVGQIEISGSRDSDYYIIRCVNDGGGEIPRAAETSDSGLGIKLMEASAEKIGAMMTIEPGAEKFTLELELPVDS